MKPAPHHNPPHPPAADSTFNKLPVFDPRDLRRQLSIDQLLRWVAAIAMLIILVYVFTAGSNSILLTLGIISFILAWFTLKAINARTGRELSHISNIIDADPERAEHWLAAAVQRRPLITWVRLMIYHRLAMLRHKQQRFLESAAICRSVLAYRLGPAESSRAHLLLILAEASLETRDIPTAYSALSQLYNIPLSLTEALQRLALQTRYELLSGNHAAALQNLTAKIEMAELLPAPQCGAIHQMLYLAATRAGHTQSATFLDQRVRLLLTPEQREQIITSVQLA